MNRIVLYTCITLAFCVMTAFSLQTQQPVRYLPLGDSYTIGTGASAKEAWPTLLTAHLNEKGIACTLLDNPARNGYTTQNLIDRELPLLKTLKPDFVTVLNGVNDWVRGVPVVRFNDNLVYILDEVQKALPDKKKVLLVTIPDFGVTPQGQKYSNGRNISQGISEFNTIIKLEAKKRGLAVADIFELSKKMGSDASLVAHDGLHASAKGYALWETVILPEAVKVLK